MDAEQLHRALAERAVVSSNQESPKVELSWKPMSLEDYLVEIPKSMSPLGDNLDHCVEGICDEAGELIGAYKKRWYGREVDRINVLEEMGDLCWFLGNYWRLRGSSMKLNGVLFPVSDTLGTQIEITQRIFLSAADMLESFRAGNHTLADHQAADIYFQISALAMSVGVSMENVFRLNINKLLGVRYKGGFSAFASANRDKDAERGALGQKSGQ